ncbi:hypothetical protein COE07_26040 [Bacillus sp. AFS033286]|nr:hypothetical protein COE07_26040 [Bacillus sp. AFS033286]
MMPVAPVVPVVPVLPVGPVIPVGFTGGSGGNVGPTRLGVRAPADRGLFEFNVESFLFLFDIYSAPLKKLFTSQLIHFVKETIVK